MPFPRRITQRKALRTNSIHSASPTLLTQAVILTLTPWVPPPPPPHPSAKHRRGRVVSS